MSENRREVINSIIGHDPPAVSTGSTTSAAEYPDAVRVYFEALNAEDWDSMKVLWSQDSVLQAVGSRPRRGDDILSYFRLLFASWQTHLEGPTRVVVAGEIVVAEVAFAGVTHSGREVAFDAVDLFDLDGDVIRHLRTWYDLAWVRSQL